MLSDSSSKGCFTLPLKCFSQNFILHTEEEKYCTSSAHISSLDKGLSQGTSSA